MALGILETNQNIHTTGCRMTSASYIFRAISIITCTALIFFSIYFSNGERSLGDDNQQSNEVYSISFDENTTHSFNSTSWYHPSSPLPPTSAPFSPAETEINLLPITFSFNFSETVKTFGLVKVFQSPISPLDKSWCTTKNPKHGKHGIPTGILYNKMPKAASSTMAGITLRIAHRLGRRLYGDQTICTNHVNHVAHLNFPGKLFSNRDRSRSFLFSTLRDPAKRSSSRIFFQASKNAHKKKKKKKKKHKNEKSAMQYEIDANDKKIIQRLNTTKVDHQYGVVDIKRAGFQVAYTIMNVSDDISVYDPSHPGEISNIDNVISMVRRILNDYDFMVLVERFDECIVLMQLLLGLETSDILYLSAKKSGGYYHDGKKCINIVKGDTSPLVLEFLSSKDWHARNYADYLLIEAVSQSIDLTIESIGRNKFDEAFEKFQNMKKYALEECEDKAIFPCDSTGHPQIKASKSNCYKKDSGCGYPCLDSLKI